MEEVGEHAVTKLVRFPFHEEGPPLHDSCLRERRGRAGSGSAVRFCGGNILRRVRENSFWSEEWEGKKGLRNLEYSLSMPLEYNS